MIIVSQKVINDVFSYADILMSNSAELAHAYKKKDFRALTRRAFGEALVTIDLDDPLEENFEELSGRVKAWLLSAVSDAKVGQTFVFGSWLLSGSDRGRLLIGPVMIESRSSWLDRSRSEGHISPVTAARLTRRWNGQAVRRRKSASEHAREMDIIDAVDRCSHVTSVITENLVSGAAEEKALQVARLAHSAVALLWETPSSVLARMGLKFDGDMYRQHYIVLINGKDYGASSSVSRLPGPPHAPSDWEDVWSASHWFISPIAAALAHHLNPELNPIQPRVLTALFLALWWFHDACRENSPLFAIVKFAASMDALANGGKKRGITQLIDVRRGAAPGAALLANGRTTSDVIGEIYDTIRSRTIHGTIDNVGHDWSEIRARAEMLSRLCLRFACAWINDNAASDDLDAMRR